MTGTDSIGTALEIYRALKQTDLPEAFALKAYEVILQGALDGAMPAANVRSVAVGGNGDSDSGLGGLAARLGLTEDQVAALYSFERESLEVIVSPGLLAPSVASAARELALLVVAGRQGAGGEQWTSATDVRLVCQEYNRFDSANFATTIGAMENDFRFRGKGRARELLLTRPGWEHAGELARRLAGGS